MLKNTIIVGITSPEQHKRVQEKLFGMGCEWIGSRLEIKNTSKYDLISIDNDGKMWQNSDTYLDFRYPDHKRIPASEFLWEEEPKTNMERMKEISDIGWRGRRLILTWDEAMKKYDDNPELINKLININNPSTSPRTGKVTNIMSNIVNFAKDLLLSADEKLLRKYDLKDGQGEYTTEAEDLVRHKLLVDNEPYLLEIAKAKEADEKANKSN